MLNIVILQGRFASDPELRHTNSGIPVTSFRFAVERDYKPQNGERKADFFDVTAWQHEAEFISSHFSKGEMATIHGRLENQKYTDRDDKTHQTTKVIVQNIYFCGSKGPKGRPEGPSCGQSLDSGCQPGEFDESECMDGDLPF